MADVNATATALLVSNGNALVGGTSYDSDETARWLLVQFSPAGKLDEDFMRNAATLNRRRGFIEALAHAGTLGTYVAGVLEQADPEPSVAVSLVQRNGVVSSKFGTGGNVIPQTSMTPDAFKALFTDEAGRAILAYESREGHVGLTRFTTEGAPDDSFGRGGVVSPPLTGAVFTQDRRRRILVAGRQRSGNGLVVQRYSADGRLDSSFGDAGTVTLSARSVHVDLRRVGPPIARIIGTETGFLLGVSDNSGTDYRHYFTHFDSNGDRSRGFGRDQFIVGDVARINDVLLTASGRLVLIGDNSGGSGLVQRRLLDGTIDRSFNGGTIFPQPSRSDDTLDDAASADGRVIVTGSTSTEPLESRLFIARLRD